MATMTNVTTCTFTSIRDRNQIGPLNLDELRRLIAHVRHDRRKERAILDDAAARLASRQEAARRRFLAETFGNEPFDPTLTFNDRRLALLDAGDCRRALGPAGTADAYSFRERPDLRSNRCGVYLSPKSVLAALDANPRLEALAFASALAGHRGILVRSRPWTRSSSPGTRAAEACRATASTTCSTSGFSTRYRPSCRP